METAILSTLAIVTASLAVSICGLVVSLVFAYKLRGVLRRHRRLLNDTAINSTHLTGQITEIAQRVRGLTEFLGDVGRVLSLDVSRIGRGDQSDIVLGPMDTFEQLDQQWGSINDPTGRQETACSIDGDRRRVAVIVILGQSNAANHGVGKYAAKRRVDNFNLYDGKCYHAADPLLGASGEGGNFTTRLGDKLIDAGLFDRVILAPIAMGGTTVEQWAEEGMFNRRIPAVIKRLYNAGLSIDLILWQQGEGNQGFGDIGGRQYRKNLSEVIWTFRRYGVAAPFFVSLTTTCGGPHPQAENIRAGQKSIVNPSAAIYQGPDTDTVGSEYRWDDCHFNEAGLERVATLWFEVIAEFERTTDRTPRPAGGNDC